MQREQENGMPIQSIQHCKFEKQLRDYWGFPHNLALDNFFARASGPISLSLTRLVPIGHHGLLELPKLMEANTEEESDTASLNRRAVA